MVKNPGYGLLCTPRGRANLLPLKHFLNVYKLLQHNTIMKIFTKRNLFLLFSFIAIFLILVWLWNNVIILSYGSVVAACAPQKFEDQFPNATILGRVTVIHGTNMSDDAVPQIIVQIFDNRTSVIQHEQCHVKQATRRFSFSASCRKPTNKFLTEFECYLTEGLPMPVHNFLYS